MNLGRMSRRDLLGLLGAAAASGLPAAMIGPARAQARFPDRPIRLVVPFPPGGIYDALGRPWADKMKTLLGAVVVENVGGAGGAIGGSAVVRARPDGYTLLLGAIAINVINAVATTRPLYDPRQLESVAILASAVFSIAVHPSVPVQSLPELIRFAGANPGSLSYGTAGTGSLNHLTGERLKSLTGLTHITHVPYRSTTIAMPDMIAGRIDYICEPIQTALPLIQPGTVKPIATLSRERSRVLANVPSAHEQGLTDFDAPTWFALFLPKGTPEAIVRRLNKALSDALDTPSVRERLEGSGMRVASPEQRSSEYLGKLVVREIEKYSGPIRASGVSMD